MLAHFLALIGINTKMVENLSFKYIPHDEGNPIETPTQEIFAQNPRETRKLAMVRCTVRMT